MPSWEVFFTNIMINGYIMVIVTVIHHASQSNAQKKGNYIYFSCFHIFCPFSYLQKSSTPRIFPEPLLPTKAVVHPAGTVTETFFNTKASGRLGYEKQTSAKTMAPSTFSRILLPPSKSSNGLGYGKVFRNWWVSKNTASKMPKMVEFFTNSPLRCPILSISIGAKHQRFEWARPESRWYDESLLWHLQRR